MRIIYDHGKDGIRVLRCFSFDGHAEIPETIGGEPVTEIGAYAFSETFRGTDAGEKYEIEILDGEDAPGEDGRKVWHGELAAAQELVDGTPVLSGNRLQEVRFPSGLKKIGRYAFYNCEELSRLTLSSTLQDLGAGLFTGCRGIRHLDIRMVSGEKSCLKEVLSELRQTLRVDYRNEQGELRAKLIFPEYFEESVENTPARILTQEMHGCGHRYRNAFSGTEFQFLVYDKQFPHVKVQEPPVFVTELVLGRLMYPCLMADAARTNYEEYAASHGNEIVKAALLNQDMDILRFAGNASWCSGECMDQMLKEAGLSGNPQALGILMDIRYQKRKMDEAVGEAAGEAAKETAGEAEKEAARETVKEAAKQIAECDETGQPAKAPKRRRRFEW